MNYQQIEAMPVIPKWEDGAIMSTEAAKLYWLKEIAYQIASVDVAIGDLRRALERK